MGEFKDGTLDNGHGGRVTSRKQALAIALSKARELTAAGWDESKHPRDPGGEGGGQWTSKGEGQNDFKVEPNGKIMHHNGSEWEQIGDASDYEADPKDVKVYPDGRVMVFSDGAWAEEDQINLAGPEEDDGEVDPYATDFDEAGGTPTDGQRDSFDSGYAEMDWLDDADDDEIRGEWEEIHTDPDRYGEADPDYVDGQKERLMEVAQERGIELKEYDPDAPDRGNTASAMTASAVGLAPLVPPKQWFEKPTLEGPTGMTVTADGQVYGHAALWGTCHTGMPGVCRTPPRSSSDYRFFHLGEVDTDGGPVAVGRVTMDTGHAPLTASRDGAVRHYDDTGTGIAHVRAYEDDHGIVLAGALVPDAPAEKARRFRGATVSGDWRSIGGKLELVGMLAVNVPGFPVPRAMAASLMVEDEPHTMALVAAGVYRDAHADETKLKALTARAMGGIDGLAAAAGYEPANRRRMGVTAAGRPFDPAKHPRHPGGSPAGGRFRAELWGPGSAKVIDNRTGEVVDVAFTLAEAERKASERRPDPAFDKRVDELSRETSRMTRGTRKKIGPLTIERDRDGSFHYSGGSGIGFGDNPVAVAHWLAGIEAAERRG